MAHFYCSIHGQAKTPATRRGSEASGIQSHTRGWNLGVKVMGEVTPAGDVFHIFATGGSNSNGKGELLGTFTPSGFIPAESVKSSAAEEARQTRIRTGKECPNCGNRLGLETNGEKPRSQDLAFLCPPCGTQWEW